MIHTKTGEPLESLLDICNMMRDLRIPVINFYTNSFNPIIDGRGKVLPNGNLITITHNWAGSFNLMYNGLPTVRFFRLTINSSGKVTQTEYNVGPTINSLTPLVDDDGEKLNTIEKMCDFLIDNNRAELSFYTSSNP